MMKVFLTDTFPAKPKFEREFVGLDEAWRRVQTASTFEKDPVEAERMRIAKAMF